jgi:hypothetical protein
MTSLLEQELGGELAGPQVQPMAPTPAPSSSRSPLEMELSSDPSLSIQGAVGLNPDEEAKKQKLGKAAGLPQEAVDADPVAVEQYVKTREMSEKLLPWPVTSNWFSKPENANVASDDVDTLVTIEGLWGIKTKVAKYSPEEYGLRSNAYLKHKDAPLDVARLAGAGAFNLVRGSAQTLGSLNDFGVFVPGALGDLAKASDIMRPGIEDLYNTIRGPQNVIPAPIAGGIESAATTLTALATGNPLTAIAGITYGNSYQTAIDQGASPQRAAVYGVLDATIEVATEKLPLKYLTDLIKGGSPFLRTFTKQLVAENIGEQAATALQDMNEWLVLHPERTASDYFVERPNRALETLIATNTAVALQTGVGKMMGVMWQQNADKAAAATAFTDSMDATQKALKASNLGPRDPEKLAEHAATVLGAAGHKEIYLSVDGIDALAEKLELPAEQVAEKLGVLEEYKQEAANGGVIRFSTQDFTTKVLMGEDYSTLSDYIMETPDGVTRAEVKDYETQLKSELEDALTQEYIVSAGVIVGDKVYTGATHVEAYEDARDVEKVEDVLVAGNDGFVTNTGRYVSREEAVAINRLNGQKFTESKQKYAPEGAVSENTKLPQGGKLISQGVVPLIQQAEAAFNAGLPFTEGMGEAELDILKWSKELGVDGIFKTAEEAGFKPGDKEYMFYLANLKRMFDAAVVRQNEKMLKVALGKTKTEWKKLRKEERAVVERAIRDMPVYKALADIQRDKLDRETLVSLIGEKALAGLPRHEPTGDQIYTKKGEEGIDPSILAESHGFASASDMLTAMYMAKPIKQAIDETTDAVMNRKYNPLATEKARLEEALESLHGDFTGEVLIQELNRLRELAAEKKATKKAAADAKKAAAGPTAKKPDSPETKAKKQAAVKVRQIKLRVLKAAIKEKLAGTKVKDIAVNRFVATAKKEGKLAAAALRKGDIDQAAEHKFKQIVNVLMTQQAYKIRSQVAKENKYLTRFDGTRKKVKIPASYVERIRELTSKYNLGSKLTEKTKTRIQDWVAAQEAAGAIFSFPKRLLDDAKRHWGDLSYGEWESLIDAVKNIEAQGRTKKTLGTLRAKTSFEHQKSLMLAQAASLPDTAKAAFVPRKSLARLAREKAARGLASFDSALVKVRELLKQLDQENVGIWWKNIYKPVSDAYVEQQDMMRNHVMPLMKQLNKLPKAVRKLSNKRVFVPSLGQEFTRSQLMMMALNVGNVSNFRKLVDGHNSDTKGKKWSDQDVLDAMALLSPEEARWVQEVWNYFETMRPLVELVYAEEHGYTATPIEAKAVEVGGVKLKGGYFPVMYEHTPNHITAMDALTDKQVRASVFAGMTKERVDFAAPVLLDINRLMGSMERVIHFVTHYNAIRNTSNILKDPELSKMIRDKLGEDYLEEFKDWNAAVATNGMVGLRQTYVDKVVETLRHGVTAAVLGFKYTTLMAQTLGVFAAVGQVGQSPKNTGKFSNFRGLKGVGSGYLKYISDPVGATKDAMLLSGELRNRFGNADREVAHAMGKYSRKISTRQMWNHMALTPIAAAQLYMVDIPVWIGAYNTGLQDGKSPEDAVNYADDILINSQGSGSTKDMSAIQRQKGLMRALTMFSTYALVLYNMERDMVKQGGKGKVAFLSQWMRAMWIIAIPAMLQAMVAGDEPDEEESELMFQLRNITSLSVSSVPFLGYLASGVVKGFDPSVTALDTVPKAALALYDDIAGVIQDGDELQISKVLRNAGVALGIGGSIQASRTMSAFENADEASWYDYLVGYREE